MQFEFVDYNDTTTGECYFRKTQGQDLILICNVKSYGILKLKKIAEEILLNDINYKYNFIILPIINNEQINIARYNWGTDVKLTYPLTLNFTFEDSLIIKYIMTYPLDSNKIRLNPNSNFLNCSNSFYTKTCIVSLSHFQGKNIGYFNTYYSFEYNNSLITNIYYESNPFNVILPPKNIIVLRIKKEFNKEGIKIGNQGILYFITDYDDKEKNVFDTKDIENKTHFETKIIDKDNNEYYI